MSELCKRCNGPKHRGRCKKMSLTVIPISLNGENATTRSLESPRFPTADDVRFRQSLIIRNSLHELEEPRKARADQRAELSGILLWFATPYADRVPLTLIELSQKLNYSPLKLQVIASMYGDVISRATAEIRRAAQDHGRMRYMKAFDGICDAAEAGNVQAFGRLREEAFDVPFEPPHKFVANVNVTIDQLIDESEEAVAMPSWVK